MINIQFKRSNIPPIIPFFDYMHAHPQKCRARCSNDPTFTKHLFGLEHLKRQCLVTQHNALTIQHFTQNQCKVNAGEYFASQVKCWVKCWIASTEFCIDQNFKRVKIPSSTSNAQDDDVIFYPQAAWLCKYKEDCSGWLVHWQFLVFKYHTHSLSC